MFRSLPFPGFTLQDMCTCGHQQNMTVGVSCWCPQVSIFYSWRSSFWWNSAYNQTVDDCCVEGWWVCKSHVVDTGESIIMHLDGFQHHLRRNFACRLGAVASARFCQDPLHWYECGIGALVWTGVQILAVCNCWAIRNLSCPSHSCTLLEFGSQIWISTWVWDESGGGFRCELSMTRIILLEAWLDNGGRFSTRKFVLFTSFVRVLHWKICVSHQFCMFFTSFDTWGQTTSHHVYWRYGFQCPDASNLPTPPSVSCTRPRFSSSNWWQCALRHLDQWAERFSWHLDLSTHCLSTGLELWHMRMMSACESHQSIIGATCMPTSWHHKIVDMADDGGWGGVTTGGLTLVGLISVLRTGSLIPAAVSP